MFYPDNRPVSRPRVPQADIYALSARLTAGLQAIQTRERNHEALVRRAEAVLPTLEA